MLPSEQTGLLAQHSLNYPLGQSFTFRSTKVTPPKGHHVSTGHKSGRLSSNTCLIPHRLWVLKPLGSSVNKRKAAWDCYEDSYM